MIIDFSFDFFFFYCLTCADSQNEIAWHSTLFSASMIWLSFEFLIFIFSSQHGRACKSHKLLSLRRIHYMQPQENIQCCCTFFWLVLLILWIVYVSNWCRTRNIFKNLLLCFFSPNPMFSDTIYILKCFDHERKIWKIMHPIYWLYHLTMIANVIYFRLQSHRGRIFRLLLVHVWFRYINPNSERLMC